MTISPLQFLRRLSVILMVVFFAILGTFLWAYPSHAATWSSDITGKDIVIGNCFDDFCIIEDDADDEIYVTRNGGSSWSVASPAEWTSGATWAMDMNDTYGYLAATSGLLSGKTMWRIDVASGGFTDCAAFPNGGYVLTIDTSDNHVMSVDPSIGSSTIYAIGANGSDQRLYKSSTACASWTELTPRGTAQDLNIMNVSANGDTVMTNSFNGADGADAWLSSDAGVTWTRISVGGDNGFYWTRLAAGTTRNYFCYGSSIGSCIWYGSDTPTTATAWTALPSPMNSAANSRGGYANDAQAWFYQAGGFWTTDTGTSFSDESAPAITALRIGQSKTCVLDVSTNGDIYCTGDLVTTYVGAALPQGTICLPTSPCLQGTATFSITRPAFLEEDTLDLISVNTGIPSDVYYAAFAPIATVWTVWPASTDFTGDPLCVFESQTFGLFDGFWYATLGRAHLQDPPPCVLPVGTYTSAIQIVSDDLTEIYDSSLGTMFITSATTPTPGTPGTNIGTVVLNALQPPACSSDGIAEVLSCMWGALLHWVNPMTYINVLSTLLQQAYTSFTGIWPLNYIATPIHAFRQGVEDGITWASSNPCENPAGFSPEWQGEPVVVFDLCDAVDEPVFRLPLSWVLPALVFMLALWAWRRWMGAPGPRNDDGTPPPSLLTQVGLSIFAFSTWTVASGIASEALYDFLPIPSTVLVESFGIAVGSWATWSDVTLLAQAISALMLLVLLLLPAAVLYQALLRPRELAAFGALVLAISAFV